MGKASHLAGSPSAFACYDGIESVARITQGDGLHDTYLRNAVGQFAQVLLAELASWLIGVGPYQHHVHFAYAR